MGRIGNFVTFGANRLEMKLMLLLLTLLHSVLCLQAHTELRWSQEQQSISVQCLNPENGLSHARVNASYRDEFGRLWIGTDDGLNMFDDKKIEIFRPDGQNSINTNAIIGLCGDKNGHLFITGRQSLSILDFRTMTFKVLEENDVKIACFHSGYLCFVIRNEVYSYDITNGKTERIF